MRILYVCSDLGIPVLGRKGASVHVRGLAEALQRAGHEVLLAAAKLTKSPWEAPSATDVPVLHVPPGPDVTASVLALKGFRETLDLASPLPGELRRILYNQQLGGELVRRFESSPPDVVYERASLYATAGVTLARELNVPLIVELNAPLALERSAYWPTGLRDLAAQAEQGLLSQADAVLAVSQPLREHAVLLGADAARVHVVPNGIDPARFGPAIPDPSVRARLGLNGGPVLGFVGGLRPWHGVEALPELLGRLSGRFPGLQLVIAGDGPLRDELERAFRKHELSDSVVFTGSLPHEEVPALIRQLDVAVAPYRTLDHAFYFSPLKLFEYMACGVPVVAAELGQIGDVVRHGETGLLYPPGELDGLVEACGRLLQEPALRRRLGRAGAAEVRSRYTWDQNAETVVELAKELVAEREVER